MRNFNTSFVKTASSFFANEASRVLREIVISAMRKLRLMLRIGRQVSGQPDFGSATPCTALLTGEQKTQPADTGGRLESVMPGCESSYWLGTATVGASD